MAYNQSNNSSYYPPTSGNANTDNTYSTVNQSTNNNNNNEPTSHDNSAYAANNTFNNNTNNGAVPYQQATNNNNQGLFNFSDWWRWVIFVFLVLGVGCGITSNVLTPKMFPSASVVVMWSAVSSTQVGVWQQCTTAACANNFPDGFSSNACSSGLSTKNRYIVFVSMVMTGLCFAFLTWPLCFVTGKAMDILRHVFLFLSFAGWTVALVFFGFPHLFIDCAKNLPTSSFGISFWLGVGGGICSFIAFNISWIYATYIACCADPAKNTTNNNQDEMYNNNNQQGAAAGTNDNYNNNNNNGVSNSYATSGNPAAVHPNDYSQASAGQGQQQDKNNTSQFTELVNQQQAPSAEADADPRDPASVGLEEHWYFDDASGYWWSDQAQLYYDADTQSYGNPTDGTWYNSETGEWS